MGYLPQTAKSVTETIEVIERRLLQAVIWNECHVLRGLFPETVKSHYKLRPRQHNFQLPPKDDRN